MPMVLFLKMIYALGIGVLIGLERSLLPCPPQEEKPVCQDPDHSSTNSSEKDDTLLGVRTYSILSLGGFAAALAGSHHIWIAPVLLTGLIALVISMYHCAPTDDPGITTEIAAVVCCGLGFLCFYESHAAGVIALLVTVLLSIKKFVKGTLRRLKRVELVDTLKFLAIILIVLPLLPDKTLDPYGAFNPFKVTFLVILISGISFVGYFLTKFLGAQTGLGLTGLLGGLTSSTAVTAAMANQAKEAPGLIQPCAFATVIANATMFGRVLVVVAVLDRALMLELLWSIGTMTLAALTAVLILWIRFRKQQSGNRQQAARKIILENPFSLGPAIKFALFFVLILLAAKLAQIHLGDRGIYLASLVSGLADVDAITLTLSEQTRDGQLARHIGAVGITVAVIANSIVKSGIAFYSGGWRFGRLVGLVLMAATGAGLAVLLAV